MLVEPNAATFPPASHYEVKRYRVCAKIPIVFDRADREVRNADAKHAVGQLDQTKSSQRARFYASCLDYVIDGNVLDIPGGDGHGSAILATNAAKLTGI